MTLNEVKTYLASEEWRNYLVSETFALRGLEFERRRANGPITVQDGARIMELPVDVFRWLYSAILADEAAKGTEH
jgi:hypothetical protein